MMILRTTMFSPDLEPVSVVLRESDLRVPIEEARQERMDGGFVVWDLFEIDGDPDIITATVRAAERQEERAERERAMALLYYWDAEALRAVNPGGVLTATLPAPLTTHEIKTALTQLAEHPNYRRQLVVAISEDFKVVTMRDGNCKITDMRED